MESTDGDSEGIAGVRSSTTAAAEVGWYILGDNQEHVGPYAVSELQG